MNKNQKLHHMAFQKAVLFYEQSVYNYDYLILHHNLAS